jgi:hypothetical protein
MEYVEIVCLLVLIVAIMIKTFYEVFKAGVEIEILTNSVNKEFYMISKEIDAIHKKYEDNDEVIK